MQFIDLTLQQRLIRSNINAAINQVLDHGQYIMGPEVFELEKRLADYVGVKHCVSCASGTDALLMALMAQGIGPGDAIFTTPFTFVATGEAISLLGATPVFVDIDPETFNIDPKKLEQAVKAVMGEGPIADGQPHTSNHRPLTARGIVPVDLFGLPADYDAINAIAKNYGLFVLEDAAQAFGGTYKKRTAGSLADVAATSFFPAKPLGCYGDGGALFTDDDILADILRSIRVHGKGDDKYDNVRIGLNGRLDTLQAAILLPKLDIFPDEVIARQQVANRYTALLAERCHEILSNNIQLPIVPDGYTSAWAQYSLLLASNEQRNALQQSLSAAGIPTAIYYPKPLHLQTTYAALGYGQGAFPRAEDIAQRILSLPMGPYLHEKEQIEVVEAIRGFFVKG